MHKRLDARARRVVAVLWCRCALGALAGAEDSSRPGGDSPLEHGFSGLYNLDFAGAQRDFTAWQQLHPEDPVGPVSEAAGCLFSEFNRLGGLEGQLYENDDVFVGRPKLTPDPTVRERFLGAIRRAENLSRTRLTKDPK